MSELTSPEMLETRLRDIGRERYHNNHPFHKLLHGGDLNKGQVQAWALNRYYYQSRIPMKDAALMSRISEPALRRDWSQRVIDHDGSREGQGGIARWTQSVYRSGTRWRLRGVGGRHPVRHQIRRRRLCGLCPGTLAA